MLASEQKPHQGTVISWCGGRKRRKKKMRKKWQSKFQMKMKATTP